MSLLVSWLTVWSAHSPFDGLMPRTHFATTFFPKHTCFTRVTCFVWLASHVWLSPCCRWPYGSIVTQCRPILMPCTCIRAPEYVMQLCLAMIIFVLHWNFTTGTSVYFEIFCLLIILHFLLIKKRLYMESGFACTEEYARISESLAYHAIAELCGT